MELRSSKWAYVTLGLILAVGVLPNIASGQPTGTATQVGAPPPKLGQAGGGQVSFSDTIPLPPACLPSGALDLRLCVLTNNAAVSPSIEILFDMNQGTELVTNCVGAPPFLLPGAALPARRGGKPNEVIFESDSRVRPTFKVQVKNRGRGVLEIGSGLKVDRACINDTVPPQPAPPPGVPIRTSFALVCPSPCGTISYDDDSTLWRTTGRSGGNGGWNIKTP